MPRHPFIRVPAAWLAGCTLLTALLSAPPAHAERLIEERRPADPQGAIEVSNVAGSIDIQGWDRPEVEVKGTADEGVDRVEVTTTGSHTSVRVVLAHGIRPFGGGEVRLVIHVPAHSTVAATQVSAALTVNGVLGDAKLETVSGSIGGEVGGDLRISDVSGPVRMTARGARRTEISTVSGDVTLTGNGGELQITTISGAARVEADTLASARLKTVSGTLSARLGLTADGKLDAESVSGAIGLAFPSPPAADFDVQTLSGTIASCFGPKPERRGYGPGTRLVFKQGEGRARVHVSTQSGSVDLCARR